jgi:hypothetical protein
VRKEEERRKIATSSRPPSKYSLRLEIEGKGGEEGGREVRGREVRGREEGDREEGGRRGEGGREVRGRRQ